MVPDANSDRCKVVIEGCNLDTVYRVIVAAIPTGKMGLFRFPRSILFIMYDLIFFFKQCSYYVFICSISEVIFVS